ncbi:MAG: hypothetical protein ISQ13_03990 [Candidatus Margulisbacteria bacterium]|nr:hypothetical protein [Candidatus Margulisiibacteriota bacterium]
MNSFTIKAFSFAIAAICWGAFSHALMAQENAFELKQPEVPPPVTKEKPLFELLNNTPQKTNSNTNNKWGSNPFFKAPSVPSAPEQLPVATVPEPTHLFEYKITAIWKVNDDFKALISGHIVSAGDRINNIQITKITNKDITVKQSSKLKTFRLGTLFYDFQI